MCTASWLVQEKSFDLFFNRDEARTRGIAKPPEICEQDGVRYIAPHDADFGGTWIAVNEFGISLCLLNNYQAMYKEGNFTSRGALIPEVIAARDLAGVTEYFKNQNLQKFRPFVLAAFCGNTAWSLTWSGEIATENDNPTLPLISSAFNFAQALENRSRQFVSQNPLTPQNLLTLHKSHTPEKGPLSICMHRPEAHTVSLSHVQITTDQITFEYFAGNPCTAENSTVVNLPRRI